MPGYYIPPEVLTTIIRYVDCTKTLKDVTLVSKAGRDATLPFLFRDIFLTAKSVWFEESDDSGDDDPEDRDSEDDSKSRNVRLSLVIAKDTSVYRNKF